MRGAPPIRPTYRLFAPRLALPAYLLFFVTSKCHATCPHCFYWSRLNRDEEELSVAEIDAIARSIGPLLQLTITGGSPELRRDLPEVMETLVRRCRPVNVTLCSSGGYPRRLRMQMEALLERIPELGLTIDISLDALGDRHDELRGIPGLFKRLQRTYQLLAELKPRYAGLRLGCGVSVHDLNRGEVMETAEWAMANLPIDNLTPILVRGRPRDPAARASSEREFLEVARAVEARLGRRLGGYSAYSSLVNAKDVVQKRVIADVFRTGTSPVPCSAGHQTAVIYPDGTVPGCETRTDVLGNLRDVGLDFRRIWFGPEARAYRERIRRERCACWHQCFLSASIVRSPRMWPALVTAAAKTARRSAKTTRRRAQLGEVER